ncbi:MAG: hypothetical protein ACXVZJ_12065 [Terriglobales bacterium]
MKKLIAFVSAVMLSSPCFAETITLICKGWVPFYTSFEAKPANPPSEDEPFTIKLDTSKHLASYETQLGEVSTSFKEKTDYYFGGTNLEPLVGGKKVSVSLSINRLNGSTDIFYTLDNNSKDMRVAFSGKCAPGKPLF